MRFALIALLALLAACAPNISANPGEIVYQIKETPFLTSMSSFMRLNSTDAAGRVTIVLGICDLVQSRGSSSLQGYAPLKIDQVESRRLSNYPEQKYVHVYNSKHPEHTGTIRMVWNIKNDTWPTARLTLKTESNDSKLDVGVLENSWFACLDKEMTRVASAR